jgi:hypothetical protein
MFLRIHEGTITQRLGNTSTSHLLGHKCMIQINRARRFINEIGQVGPLPSTNVRKEATAVYIVLNIDSIDFHPLFLIHTRRSTGARSGRFKHVNQSVSVSSIPTRASQSVHRENFDLIPILLRTITLK